MDHQNFEALSEFFKVYHKQLDQEAALSLEGLGVYATDGGRPVEAGVETDWEVSPGKVNGFQPVHTRPPKWVQQYGSPLWIISTTPLNQNCEAEAKRCCWVVLMCQDCTKRYRVGYRLCQLWQRSKNEMLPAGQVKTTLATGRHGTRSMKVKS